MDERREQHVRARPLGKDRFLEAKPRPGETEDGHPRRQLVRPMNDVTSDNDCKAEVTTKHDCCNLNSDKKEEELKPILEAEDEGNKEETDEANVGEELEEAREEGEAEEDMRCGECGREGEDSLSPGEATGESEEGRRPVGVKSPITVTKEQRDEHEKTHTPF